VKALFPGTSPGTSVHTSTARVRTRSQIVNFRNVAHVARRVAEILTLFTAAVEFGHAAYIAWHWLDSIGVLF